MDDRADFKTGVVVIMKDKIYSNLEHNICLSARHGLTWMEGLVIHNLGRKLRLQEYVLQYASRWQFFLC